MMYYPFTRQYRDRSDIAGFQFEFWCDVCNHPHITPYQYNPVGVASSLMTAASYLLRGGYNWSAAGREVRTLMRGKAWEQAYLKSLMDAKEFFRQCSRCNRWA